MASRVDVVSATSLSVFELRREFVAEEVGSRVHHAVCREENAQGWECRAGNVATYMGVADKEGSMMGKGWVKVSAIRADIMSMSVQTLGVAQFLKINIFKLFHFFL